MLGSAEGIGRGSSIALTLNEAWHSPSLWPAMFLTIWIACSSSCSVSSENLLSYFLGHGYPEAQTGQGRWEKVWSGLCDVLICEELTMTPHTFLRALPFASRVTSKPAGHTDRDLAMDTRSSGYLLCQSRESRPASPEISRGCLSNGTCVSLVHMSII